jgi:hypothetical protein
MIRFIVRRHHVLYAAGIDDRTYMTLDLGVPELERILNQGGSGEGGFESWDLLGVEILDEAIEARQS